MTSMERVMTTMNHQEPDQVPLFLLTTMHGAKELGLSIREYFSRAENVVEGQMRLLKKYRNDCLNCAYFAGIEAEAFGSEIIYIEDGPPNSGGPFLHRREDIDHLEPPRVSDSPGLLRVLDTIRQLKARVGETVPVLGTVISPFSLPIMQMGFDHYIELIYEDSERFEKLMAVNMSFCVEWANAQLAAGVTAIGYADPMSATTNIPRDLFLKTGQRVARETLALIHGAVAIHLASGRGLTIAGDLIATGTPAVAVSALENIGDWKAAVGDRLTLIGNLNGIEMRRWSAEKIEFEVKQAIARAGRGGGFILSDNHGEIPWQVPDEVLLEIRNAVDKWGRYPLEWLE